MPPPANARSDFHYTVGTNATDANKRNSLVEEGPLQVSAEHWLSSVLGHLLPTVANGRVQVTMRLVNYVVEADLIYDAPVRLLCPSFTLRTAFLSALFTAADLAGLDFTRVAGATLELAAY